MIWHYLVSKIGFLFDKCSIFVKVFVNGDVMIDNKPEKSSIKVVYI